jgi:DNA-binding NtrC family response regulator
MSIWYPGLSIKEAEKQIILEALRFHQGNRTHTAATLGMSLRSLINKLSDYKKQGCSVMSSPKGPFNHEDDRAAAD